jgi:hypothetical protein
MKRSRLGGEAEGLPPHLTDSMNSEMRDALDHPLRRELLRALLAGEGPQRLTDLEAEIGSDCSLAELNYHAGVLELASLAIAGEPVDRGSASGVGLGPAAAARGEQVNRILRVMQPLDRVKGRSVAAHSSRLLQMFRVPRPVITLRLGRTAKRRES